MRKGLPRIGAAVGGLCIAVSAALIAGPVTLPNTFSAGTPARAAEVNANFTAVKTAVDDNAARITGMESRVTATGNIVLPDSTADAGNVLKGGMPFIHNFGTENTFVGQSAGNLRMTGVGNTGIGIGVLTANAGGNYNTALGRAALQNNAEGAENTAVGNSALTSNLDGANNTAVGHAALSINVRGFSNTALGHTALANNTNGGLNTAIGAGALLLNTTGSENIAVGRSLRANTTGSENIAVGSSALDRNTIGSRNIAIGNFAGSTLTTGNDNIVIGGAAGGAGTSGAIRIGLQGTQTRTFIAGIRGVTTGLPGIPVLIDSDGQLGTVSSSRRVKRDIADMRDASDVLMKLRPVTFHYKSDRQQMDPTLQYGLVAEEVSEVAPELVAHSANGDIETVLYQFLAPMLLNEYQKQQRLIEEQSRRLEQQAAQIVALQRQSAGITAMLERLERAASLPVASR